MAPEQETETGRGSVRYSFTRGSRADAAIADDRVRIQLLTDPWSVWCWGFEPVRRTLELRYPSIAFSNLVGGMFPTMPRHEEVGFDVDRFFDQVYRATGMPVTTEVLRHEPRPDSTFPACVHVHAARLANPDMEDQYLRALREALYLDGQNISDRGVATKVAMRAGIDLDGFDKALDEGGAEEAFEARIEALGENKLYAYPTLLVTYRDKTTRVEGFHALPAVLSIAEAVSGQLHPPLPDPDMVNVIPYGQRVATREVAEVLGISVERAVDLLHEYEESDRMVRLRTKRADVWAWNPEAEQST